MVALWNDDILCGLSLGHSSRDSKHLWIDLIEGTPSQNNHLKGHIYTYHRHKMSFPCEPTYEDADKWFKEGNGFFRNLSKEEKDLYLTKEDDLPLGL